MTTRQLVTTLLLAVLAQIALLAVFVFLAEPQDVGGPPRGFHVIDVAYLAVPALLVAVAAVTPVRALLLPRRREQD
jgi:hypothetical protein